MKKILNFLWTITLIGTSTTSLISCNKPNNNIPCEKENHGNWKQICSSDKQFDNEDNEWYIIIWRGDVNNDWRIAKFQNKKEQRLIKFDEQNKYYIKIGQYNGGFDISINQYPSSVQTLKPWQKYNETYFKSVHRWKGTGEPNIPIIDLKTGEVTNWEDLK